MPHLAILHSKKEALSFKCSLFFPNKSKEKPNEIITALGMRIRIPMPKLLKKPCVKCSKMPYDLCAKCLYAVEEKLETLEKLGYALAIPIKD